jgi:hypothetical protein
MTEVLPEPLCEWCGHEMGNSPDEFFCRASCQLEWHQSQADRPAWEQYSWAGVRTPPPVAIPDGWPSAYPINSPS